MADVARVAGVSHQTVSRVLNHHPGVAHDTRVRVLAAIAELGYRRNTAARALVTRRSQTLGVVSFNTTLFGPASTLVGIEHAAREAGYFVSNVALETVGLDSMRGAVGHLLDQAVDGILALALHVQSVEALLELPRPIPVVALESGPEGIPLVTVGQREGAVLATEHLLERGHETVWHVAGPADWPGAQERVAGWRETLERANREPPPVLRGDWSARAGHEAAQILLRVKDLTAVFAANDHMALGVLRAFHERGVRVPEEVALVGYDDIPEAAYFTPPLTTVRQDFSAMGRAGIELLLALIVGDDRAGEQRVIAPELIVRESTGVGP
jgi:DNA-binding LacI/PurR family transcriptional regulator